LGSGAVAGVGLGRRDQLGSELTPPRSDGGNIERCIKQGRSEATRDRRYLLCRWVERIQRRGEEQDDR
jgi:hypothetical protein